MKIEEIEFYLNRGDILGAVKTTDSSEFIGWVSILKRKPNGRVENLFGQEQPDLVVGERQKRSLPYQVEVCELRKEAYEDDIKMPETSDYRMDDTFNFESLKDAISFIEKYDILLDNIRWIADVPSL